MVTITKVFLCYRYLATLFLNCQRQYQKQLSSMVRFRQNRKRNARNTNNIPLLNPKNTAFKYYFLPSIILNGTTQISPSKLLIASLRLRKRPFNSCDYLQTLFTTVINVKGNILIASLRLGLSHLREQKFKWFSRFDSSMFKKETYK